MDRKQKAVWMLEKVQSLLPFRTRLRVSKWGVPHLLCFIPGGPIYSVCYFGTRKEFRVFWPYYGDKQSKATCKLYTDV